VLGVGCGCVWGQAIKICSKLVNETHHRVEKGGVNRGGVNEDGSLLSGL
jgi:hypothetical protein